MPKVSIIIPVYNVEKYLKRCLDSVINQTLKDIEIICVNDASTDGSLAILNEYASKDKRIKLISLYENKGAGYARNIGIDHAIGDYIGFVDSDDYIDLDFYYLLYTKAIQNYAEVAKGSLLCRKNGDIDLDREAAYDNNRLIKENKAYFYHAFTSGIYLRNFLLSNQLYFPNFITFEDPNFSIKVVSKLKTIIIEDKACYYYCSNPSSVTKIINEKTYTDFIKSAKNILNYVEKENEEFKLIIYAYVFKQVERYCFSNKVSENLNKQMLDFYTKIYITYPKKELLVREYLKQQRAFTDSQILKLARKNLIDKRSIKNVK